jgi:hypothetical protein
MITQRFKEGEITKLTDTEKENTILWQASLRGEKH